MRSKQKQIKANEKGFLFLLEIGVQEILEPKEMHILCSSNIASSILNVFFGFFPHEKELLERKCTIYLFLLSQIA